MARTQAKTYYRFEVEFVHLYNARQNFQLLGKSADATEFRNNTLYNSGTNTSLLAT